MLVRDINMSASCEQDVIIAQGLAVLFSGNCEDIPLELLSRYVVRICAVDGTLILDI